MTLLVTWISCDQNKPSSVYVAADSRLSQGREIWNHGKKVFACKTQPWIFGFCGSALVISQLVSQLVDALDFGLVLKTTASFDEKWEACRRFFEVGLAGTTPFMTPEASIVFGFNRSADGKFDCGYFTITSTSIKFTHVNISVKESRVVKSMGSGHDFFDSTEKVTRKANFGMSVSRVFFSAFCRTVKAGHTPTVGGVPQLACLRTNGSGKIVPVFLDGIIWHQGIQTPAGAFTGDCFDDQFQRINPLTGKLRNNAQRQPLK